MTRLLVSVRDAAEAIVALEAGAQLIDVKEPSRGSLGAADPRQIAEVLAAVDGRLPVSAAMGELFESAVAPGGDTFPLRYAKWGLAGAALHADWTRVWADRIASLPEQTSPVAVQYADWQRARSPAPRELLTACRTHRVSTLLIDTWDKSAGGLLEVWPLASLEPFVEAARDLGLMIVLAGSLTVQSIPRVLPLAPDYIAVRGAACRGSRAGSIDPRRVRALRVLLN
jgi:uncharacterized protein (UPF0264 family)